MLNLMTAVMKRANPFVHFYLALAVCAAVPGRLGVAANAAPAEVFKPNVIIILADDQGSVDAGCYGAKDLVTPGVDRLAAQGVRFTQFYSAAPVCSPSRAGLLTGRYPWLAGMPNNGAAPAHRSRRPIGHAYRRGPAGQ